ncbi:Serine/threonine-protein kinase ATG1c [Vitis vinifera]|uniref:Serine/threonine-protein kinase ATG1c n=1 Tax=Vitis vinifera TaxID=29760 RepID=A0A438FP49_VITVI|nr:Serine/threonine-protein kinase ATG1c [Vitis vinifera]
MFQFFFGGSLQPRGIAETLCGSPLYMALEIMQLQKYDANQLLQNIVKYSELHIPPDNNDLSADCKDLCQKLLHCNPVESLTFEEFFNHPFLSQKQPDEALSSRRSSRIIDGFPLSECNPVRKTEASSQEDSMSFPLDDDSSGAEGSPSFLRKRSSMKSTYGFSLDKKVDIRETIFNSPNNMDLASKYSSASITGFRINSLRPSDENVKEPLKSMEKTNVKLRVVDSLEELVDHDYVFVSGPPMDVSSSSAIASKPSHSQCKLGSAPLTSVNMKTKSSAPMPIAGSMDIGDALEQPSTHCMTRIKSLQQCASSLNWFKKWDQLEVCLTTRNAQVGKWCMWIMRMMYFLLGMILEHYGFDSAVRHISNAYQCSSASEFVGCVRCIRILSPSEVQQMSEEGMHLLNSTTIEGINDSVKRWKPWLHQGLIINPGNLGCTQPQARLRQSGCQMQMALA